MIQGAAAMPLPIKKNIPAPAGRGPKRHSAATGRD
jgi:hypothetical protein